MNERLTAASSEEAFLRLLSVMDRLRDECPWDKKQTLETLRPLTIEETYELGDAILKGNMNELRGELGDLFLHLVFYSKICSEVGHFDVKDVLNGICDKLIFRHPHIYGDTKVDGEEDVLKNWEKLKLKEGKESVLEGVPNSLPALIKALRVQEKTKKVGFEWENRSDVWDKVKEEMMEFEELIENGDPGKREEEFGDLLFSLVNYARFCKIDPELALERTNQKFISRFRYIEKNAPKPLEEMSLEEMDFLWNEAKQISQG